MSKYDGCPWRQPNYNYGAGIIGLHEEINHFYQYILPTPCEHAVRNEVVKRVESVIHDLWPQAVVEIFGSFRTGLLLPNSDIDIVVIGYWEKKPLRTLEKELVERGVADESTLVVLDMATVPIVKYTDLKTKIRVDLSFNLENGVKAAELIKTFKREFPGLGKLVLVLKQFLMQRDLNEVFTGGISSYSIIIMCISFLQLHPRNIFHEHVNLGVLLLEFFELYGSSFNYAEIGISIRQGGCYVPQQCMPSGHRRSELCIEDPLQPDNDVGRNTYGIVAIKQAFKWANRVLNMAVNPVNLQQSSILGRIIHISDELIDNRAWLHANFNHLAVVEQISPQHAHIYYPPHYVTMASGAVKQVVDSSPTTKDTEN